MHVKVCSQKQPRLQGKCREQPLHQATQELICLENLVPPETTPGRPAEHPLSQHRCLTYSNLPREDRGPECELGFSQALLLHKPCHHE